MVCVPVRGDGGWLGQVLVGAVPLSQCQPSSHMETLVMFSEST